jgi:hypothetical protein
MPCHVITTAGAKTLFLQQDNSISFVKKVFNERKPQDGTWKTNY